MLKIFLTFKDYTTHPHGKIMVKISKHNLEIKTKIIQAYKSGSGYDVIAEWVTITKPTVWNISLKYKTENIIANGPGCSKEENNFWSDQNVTVENNPNITTKDLSLILGEYIIVSWNKTRTFGA